MVQFTSLASSYEVCILRKSSRTLKIFIETRAAKSLFSKPPFPQELEKEGSKYRLILLAAPSNPSFISLIWTVSLFFKKTELYCLVIDCFHVCAFPFCLVSHP